MPFVSALCPNRPSLLVVIPLSPLSPLSVGQGQARLTRPLRHRACHWLWAVRRCHFLRVDGSGTHMVRAPAPWPPPNHDATRCDIPILDQARTRHLYGAWQTNRESRRAWRFPYVKQIGVESFAAVLHEPRFAPSKPDLSGVQDKGRALAGLPTFECPDATLLLFPLRP
jgi:hypothetical protein